MCQGDFGGGVILGKFSVFLLITIWNASIFAKVYIYWFQEGIVKRWSLYKQMIYRKSENNNYCLSNQLP